MTARDDYLGALVEAAETVLGESLDGRTVVCPDPDRAGSRAATSYPMPAGTVVWCDPALVGRVTEVLGESAKYAITTDRWLQLALAAGAEHLGSGNNRVLVEGVIAPEPAQDGVEARILAVDDAQHMATLAAFVAGCSDDDVEEADIDLDEPDPLIVGLFDGESMVAYGSGRPYDDIPAFDDIGVLTSADHRRRGLGGRVVAEFVRRRLESDPTRRMLYRCNVDNAGSNAVAQALGFTLVHTIGAVRFPE
ncbi:MAG: GNAT family N-acetyltransferase [Ilumatobacter sp.]